MILLPNARFDGQSSFERGVDTYRAPVRVPRNQCCLLINTTTRQDFASQRPGWRQIGLKFVENQAVDVQAGFEQGYFQAFNSYVPDFGPSHQVWSISGRLFRVSPFAGGVVQEIPLPNVRPTNRQQVWFCQGEIFLFIQDGQSIPLIYWGGGIRESDVNGSSGTDPDGKPLNEIPVGTCMAYSGGRMWVALPGGRSFVAGDGVYGPTGTAAFNSRDSIIRFTENNYLAGGLPFPIPANMGPIRSMIALANLDTSLGQGPLQVFTPSGAFSIQAPLDRALWALMTDPIKTVSLLQQGAISPVGVELVNGDVWYRSLNDVWSFFIARRNFGSWGNHGMGYEVIKHLKDDDKGLLDHCSMALFDNRLFTTCSPGRSASHGIFHRGLVVLDFIPLTSLAGPEPPCWDGLWTGEYGDILQVQTIASEGVDHLYAAVLAPEDDNGIRKIQLWELSHQDGHDTDALSVKTRISRVLEGPKLDFQNKTEQKLLEGCEIWADKIRGTVDFTLFYRPDDYPCWFQWKHWQVCAKDERCAADAIDGCLTDLNLKDQYRPRMSGLRPLDDVIPFTGQPSRLGYSFQYRLEIIGEAEVTAIKLVASKVLEPTFGTGLPEEALCEEVICCPPNDFGPDGGSGGGGGGDSPSDIGACCIGGVCSVTTRALCAAGGGTFLGKGSECLEDSCGSVPPQSPLPEWPVPEPYPCGDHFYSVPIEITDPGRGVTTFVGIAPGAEDPVTYLSPYPGCIDAWAAEVWSQFIASGTPYTQARLVWRDVFTTGTGFQAQEVYPDQAGFYHPVISLDTKIVCEYCQ